MGYQALITLNHQDSQAIPFGAVVTLINEPKYEGVTGIVGDMGQVYLAGLPEKGELLVKWGNSSDSQCKVDFSLENLMTTPTNPIRQVTYTCYGKNTIKTIPTVNELTKAITPSQERVSNVESLDPTFSRWRHFE